MSEIIFRAFFHTFSKPHEKMAVKQKSCLSQHTAHFPIDINNKIKKAATILIILLIQYPYLCEFKKQVLFS